MLFLAEVFHLFHHLGVGLLYAVVHCQADGQAYQSAYGSDNCHAGASAVAADAIDFMAVEAKPNQHYRYGDECPVGTAFPHLSHLAVGFQHVAFITDNVYMGAMVYYSVGYCQ